MKKFTLFFPNRLRPKLIIDVFGDGTVYRCVKFDESIKDWVSCADGILDPEIRAAINEDVEALRWESEEWTIESLKESVAHIIGVKHA